MFYSEIALVLLVLLSYYLKNIYRVRKYKITKLIVGSNIWKFVKSI